MPRTRLELSDHIEILSILAADGTIDDELVPSIEPEMLIKLHHAMLLGRRFDERLLSLQRQGRIGTFPPISGQEAAHLGAVAVLRPTDWMVPAFRETAAELWRGRSMESVILANNGFNEGGAVAENSNNLPMAIPVGTQILHAVGLGWAVKYRGRDDAVMVFFGDGATSEGDFHEGLNFAGVYDLPVVFVCQNNQWAISVPRKKQTRSQTLAQKALAYGVTGIQVDGNDILAVFAAAQEAIERARSGKGATLIECVTYRMQVHTTADDPKRYRSDEEVAGWQKKDPLTRFQKFLVGQGMLTDDQIAEVEQEVKHQIQAAVDNAEAQMKTLGDPLDMFEHAYAEMPPHLQAQKKYLAQLIAEEKEE